MIYTSFNLFYLNYAKNKREKKDFLFLKISDSTNNSNKFLFKRNIPNKIFKNYISKFIQFLFEINLIFQ